MRKASHIDFVSVFQINEDQALRGSYKPTCLKIKISFKRGPEYNDLQNICGTAVAQWLRCCATNRKVAGSIPAGVIGFFIDIKSFRSHYGAGVDSASNRNEYQEYFLGVKAAGA